MIASQGKKGEEMVKKKLWQRGYSVKDVSLYSHFDLLWENKYRIEVKTISNWGKYGRKYFSLRKEEFDILAIVSLEQTTENIFFIHKNSLKPLMAKKLAELNKDISLDISLTSNDLRKYFKKNIKDILKYENKTAEDIKTKVIMEIKLPKIETLKCFRCNYSWYPRYEKLPKNCPSRSCHSPYWKTKRKKKSA